MLSYLSDPQQPGIPEETRDEAARLIEVRLRELAHELRQPLSTIATCAYYLHMVLPEEAAKLHAQLDSIEQQVTEADRILTQTCRDLRQAQSGRSGEDRAESRSLTNAQMAGVAY